MHIVPLSLISIPDNRQRREFLPEQINELSNSIRIHGLFHPIVCAPTPDGYRLVAGERRLRAILSLDELGILFTCGAEQVPGGSAPITLLSELDPLELREIELEENTIRVDLTWAERAAAIAALHELRVEQNKEKGSPFGAHTVANTAAELFGNSQGLVTVHESIALTKAIVADPSLAKAKNHSEAVKLLKKKSEASRRQALGASAGPSHHSILQGDSRELLSTLPSSTFACIITDPPYGVGADNFGDMASTAHTYLDSPEYAISCYNTLSFESFRVALPQAHAYVFCSSEYFFLVSQLFEQAGWSVWPRPLIWAKGNGMLPKPDFGPRYTYETILFASKGQKPVIRQGAHDVLFHAPEQDKIHAAEKPVALYSDLLGRSCYPGDLVLDPFAGSGVVFLAAEAAKLSATGIELDPTFVAECKFRISGGE